MKASFQESEHDDDSFRYFNRQATYKLLLLLEGSLAIDSKNINRSGNQAS